MGSNSIRRYLRAFGTAAAVVLLAAACGSDPETPEEGSPAEGFQEEVAGLDDVVIDEELCPNRPNPVIYTGNEFIFTGDEAELKERELPYEEIAVSGNDRYFLVFTSLEEAEFLDREDAFRQHYFWMNPIHRGHPVDTPEDPLGNEYKPADDWGNDLGGSVAVIDAVPDGEAINEHGNFIVSMLDDLGTDAELYEVPTQKGTSDSIFFTEADLLEAVAAIDLGRHDTVNLSLGTYGCPEHQPGALGKILGGIGLEVVASAGNDGSGQEMYPAADFVAVGSINAGGDRSCFSNFGPWVDYWVVGEEVLGEIERVEKTWSGTSFAAPQVAAMTASGVVASSTTPADVASPNAEYDC